MTPEQMSAFFLFALAAAITPGPSNVMVMVAGARGGLVAGLPCLGGVVGGMALMMACGQIGLAGVVHAFPASLLLLKWAGAGFLLWLAWKVANAGTMADGATANPVGFWKALAFQWVNPKSWIVSVSAAGTYGVGAAAQGVGSGLLWPALQLGGVFAAAAASSCALWLVFGASMQRWLHDARRARRFNIVMGVALAASVVLVLR